MPNPLYIAMATTAGTVWFRLLLIRKGTATSPREWHHLATTAVIGMLAVLPAATLENAIYASAGLSLKKDDNWGFWNTAATLEETAKWAPATGGLWLSRKNGLMAHATTAAMYHSVARVVRMRV